MPDGLAGLLLIIPLGLCLGSFATAMIARIPQGRSWIAARAKPERSACPQCGHRLSALDLVPLLSWLLLRGRCRYCGKTIGWRYPATECLALLMCVAVYGAWGFSAPGIVLLLAVPFLLGMLVIDLDHMILPDQLQVILFVLGLVFVFFSGPAVSVYPPALLAALIYFALAYALARGGALILKRDALGMGDVKFFAVAGLWLGGWSLPAFMMLAGAGGILLGLGWKFFVKTPRFPFGPALIFAFFVLLLLRAPAVSVRLDPFLGGFPGLS